MSAILTSKIISSNQFLRHNHDTNLLIHVQIKRMATFNQGRIIWWMIEMTTRMVTQTAKGMSTLKKTVLTMLSTPLEAIYALDLLIIGRKTSIGVIKIGWEQGVR